MNPVIEQLLQIVETDPLPAAHTSSHWQLYGLQTTVERRGDELILNGSGFGSIHVPGRLGRAAKMLERLSYRRVTARLTSYPSVWRNAKCLARDLSFDLSFGVWKQTVALAVLVDHWAAYNLLPRTFTVIGDGYGFLGALIRRQFPESRVYCIDLPKMLVFQARIHELADRGATMSIISKNRMEQADIILVLPQDVEVIPDKIDCAINIASMQEMNEFSIASYFMFLRRSTTPRSRFYCVNRMRKDLPGGEVTSFNDYPWQEDDEVFIDGACPYYTHFFGRPMLPKGPQMLGVRVPFVNYFDGLTMHRLVRLAPL